MSLGVLADDGNPHVVALGFEYEKGVLRWQARTYSRHGKYVEARPLVSFLIISKDKDSSVSGKVRAEVGSRDRDFISFAGNVDELFVRLSAEDHQEYTDAVRITSDELSV